MFCVLYYFTCIKFNITFHKLNICSYLGRPSEFYSIVRNETHFLLALHRLLCMPANVHGNEYIIKLLLYNSVNLQYLKHNSMTMNVHALVPLRCAHRVIKNNMKCGKKRSCQFINRALEKNM